ncbi:MAG: hypothetical protein ABL951_04210 [Alphaproteobacteria bacterium]
MNIDPGAIIALAGLVIALLGTMIGIYVWFKVQIAVIKTRLDFRDEELKAIKESVSKILELVNKIGLDVVEIRKNPE